jgi:hypothetical protein
MVDLYTDQISAGGRQVRVRGITADNHHLVVAGKIMKTAQVRNEWETDVLNPSAVIDQLKKSSLPIDLFTFWQRPPDVEPRFNEYYMEWDNVAAIPILGYQHWWSKQILSSRRNKLRKYLRSGVTVKVVDFDDLLVHGIMGIYNESPIRQGKPFWHYKKDFETVKGENGTYPEQSEFLGAYYDNELIGFVKLVNFGNFATLMQILSMLKHRDKSVNNGLVAKAVQVCEQKRIPYLVYDKYVYGKKGPDSLTKFKENCGFKKMDLPRYYIPLTHRGKLALRWGLHHGLTGLLPEKLVIRLIDVKNGWNEKRYGKASTPS